MSSSQVMLESEQAYSQGSVEAGGQDLMGGEEETNNNITRQPPPYSSTPQTSPNILRNPTMPLTPASMASFSSSNHHGLATNDTSQSPIRVPGTYPPEWLPDHETDACMACESPFTLIKRRHHCRSCGKIFCSDCCKQKARLLFLDNKEARVCNNCYNLIEFTLTQPHNVSANSSSRVEMSSQQQQRQQEFDIGSRIDPDQPQASSSSSGNPIVNSQLINPATRPSTSAQTILKIQGVLKNSNQASRLTNDNPNDPSNISNSSASPSSATTTTAAADQPNTHTHKQVIFSDGIRPGTDLSEPSPCPASAGLLSSGVSPSNSSFSLLSRQTHSGGETSRQAADSTNQQQQQPKKSRGSRSHVSYITVCDEIGYLPPIVISKDSPIASSEHNEDAISSITNSLTSLIINQFKSSRKSIQSSMESRNCPLNGIVKFEEISGLVGVNNVITFLLLKGFHLKVKIVQKDCCIDKQTASKLMSITSADGDNDIDLSSVQNNSLSLSETTDDQEVEKQQPRYEASSPPEYWCFTSSGLDKLGQDEIMFVLDKDKNNSCIPRDIFKTYLTLHELALRRQAIENLGNLLFQDGLFGSRDTAGLLFVRPCADHCLNNLIVPDKKFLVALVLQRWEVPWSKVFPMRLLLRLGHKYATYPYPIVSYRSRDPVYYEVGHTIISILGDFRNFRYSLTHVDGLKVYLDKTTRKVTVKLHQSNYLQFSKVLDSSNNEHVLAWSSCPFPESDGQLVAVQNDEGNYETVEFYKKSSNQNISFKNLESGPNLGASFIVFSGALKPNQSGQPAKISIVEDGLLIQIQSCTMSALRNAVHYMDNFDIDCENAQDPLNRVEIRWQTKDS